MFLSTVTLKWTAVLFDMPLSLRMSPYDGNLFFPAHILLIQTMVLNYLFQMLYVMSLHFSSPPFPFAVWTESYSEAGLARTSG